MCLSVQQCFSCKYVNIEVVTTFCHITVKQMKKKECLKKQCWHLEKNPNHQFWHQRDMAKSKKKARKEMLNAYVAQFSISTTLTKST